jgi:DNA-binding transcriptional LysR family regulator
MVLNLARTGQGLALGWEGLIDAFLKRGELVKASDAFIPSARAYFINDIQSPARRLVRAVRQWIISECER